MRTLITASLVIATVTLCASAASAQQAGIAIGGVQGTIAGLSSVLQVPVVEAPAGQANAAGNGTQTPPCVKTQQAHVDKFGNVVTEADQQQDILGCI